MGHWTSMTELREGNAGIRTLDESLDLFIQIKVQFSNQDIISLFLDKIYLAAE